MKNYNLVVYLLVILLQYSCKAQNSENKKMNRLSDSIDSSSIAVDLKKSILFDGSYDVLVNYGKLDQYSEMSLGYNIEINGDQCTFLGIGYKTYFTDECTTKLEGENLVISFVKNIEGDGFSNHSKTTTLGKIISRKNDFYIISPIVANSDWKYNTEIKMIKTKLKLKNTTQKSN